MTAISDLQRLAKLIREQNRVSDDIAALVGRPALEFIAARIFGIALASSATEKSIDGHFTSGSLVGRSVNVKWYAKRESILDITPDALPDFYLVLAGPSSRAASSRGQARPLVATLGQAGRKIGVATSVREELWRQAELYPEQASASPVLTPEQRSLLQLFSLPCVCP